jgi:hypothetical protein
VNASKAWTSFILISAVTISQYELQISVTQVYWHFIPLNLSSQMHDQHVVLCYPRHSKSLTSDVSEKWRKPHGRRTTSCSTSPSSRPLHHMNTPAFSRASFPSFSGQHRSALNHVTNALAFTTTPNAQNFDLAPGLSDQLRIIGECWLTGTSGCS